MLITSFGTYQTDEAAQLQGLYNLRHGSFELDERPTHFYMIDVREHNGTKQPVYLGTEAQQTRQGDRDFVNIEALPFYGVLWAASWLVPIPVLLLLGWTAAAYVGAKRGWGALYEHRTGRTWHWSDEETKGLGRVKSWTPSHWALIGALALWTLAQWIQLPSVDFATWGETFAVQTANIVLTAVGFVLFYRVVQQQTGSPRAAALTSAALLLGPFAAWGIGIKYHAGSMVLTIASLWLYQRGDRWRYAAFLTAGLGIAATPLGIPLFGALALVESIRIIRTLRRGGDKRLLVYFAAGLVGAVMALLAFNQFVMGHWAGHLERFFTAKDFAAGREFLKNRMRFEDWGQSMRNLWGFLTAARYVDGHPLGVWVLTPLTALAVLSPLRMRRRWNAPLAAAGTAAVLYIALFVHGAHINGGSRDLRYFSSLVPLLLLLAAMVVAPRLEAVEQAHWRPGRAFAIAAAGGVVLLWILSAAGTALWSSEPTLQFVELARILGIAFWSALVAAELGATRIATWSETAQGRLWSALTGGSLVTGALWLFHVAILERRVIPPWPIGDSERMTFLMPSLETLWMRGVELLPL